MGAILASLLIKIPSEWPKCRAGLPRPKNIHQVISPDDIGDKQVIVIGDVHGCLEELEELIHKVNFPGNQILYVFCGDILNKGPLNVETLRYVRTLPYVKLVRGNHEDHILKHCFEIKKNPSSGNELSEKYHWIKSLTDEEISFISELPYTISIPSLETIVVHAGLNPWKSLEDQDLDDMVLMRNIITSEESLPRTSKRIEVGVPWASMWSGPQHVYFGHDAKRGLQRYPLCTGLDMGCVYGGHLAAVFLTGNKELIMIKAKKVHREP